MTNFKTRKHDKQVFPVVSGKSYRREDDYNPRDKTVTVDKLTHGKWYLIDDSGGDERRVSKKYVGREKGDYVFEGAGGWGSHYTKDMISKGVVVIYERPQQDEPKKGWIAKKGLMFPKFDEKRKEHGVFVEDSYSRTESDILTRETSLKKEGKKTKIVKKGVWWRLYRKGKL